MLAINMFAYALLILPYAECLQVAEVFHKRGAGVNVSAGSPLAPSEHNSSVKSVVVGLRGPSTARNTSLMNATQAVLAQSTTPATVPRQAMNSIDGPLAALINTIDHLSTRDRIFVAMVIVAIMLALAGCTRSRELFRRCFERLYCVDTIPFITFGITIMWMLGSFLGGWAQIVAMSLFVLSLAIDFAFFSKYESERDQSGDAWHAERAWRRATGSWQQFRNTGHQSAAPWQKYTSQPSTGVMAFGR